MSSYSVTDEVVASPQSPGGLRPWWRRPYVPPLLSLGVIRGGGPHLRPHGTRGCGVSADAWWPYPRRRCPLPSGCCAASLSALAPPCPSPGGQRGCGVAADQPAASFTTAAPLRPRPWRRSQFSSNESVIYFFESLIEDCNTRSFLIFFRKTTSIPCLF